MAFVPVVRFGHFQKFEHEGVAKNVFWGFGDLPGLNEFEYPFFVLAAGKAVKKQTLFLAFEFAHAPAFDFGLFQEKRAFERVGYFQNLHEVMPAEFWGQCSQNWKFEEKHPHIVDVAVVVPASESSPQVAREVVQQLGTIFSPLLAVLLKLHYVPTYIPIGDDHGLVNCGDGFFAPLRNGLLDLGYELGVGVRCW